jgi:tricorn protease
MKALKILTVSVILLAFFFQSHSQVDARMFRYPDVSSKYITFTFAGDIWIVAKEGGLAYKLSSPKGEEQYAKFSPDGSRIAFTGNYDGNQDVYVINTLGGNIERLTNHPGGDMVIGWHPDGRRILFTSSRESGTQRYSQFYLAAPGKALPEKLPVPYGVTGCFSPDGKKFAYTPSASEMSTWKRYRGGNAGDIWIFNLETLEAENITNNDAVDGYPMWHENTIYFLSNRGEENRQNLWAYDLPSKSLRQLTHFEEFDIHNPSAGPNDIVFNAGSSLYLFNIKTETAKEVNIEAVMDLSGLKPRMVNASENLESGYPSPDGKRIVFEARGELFSVPAEYGYILNLTQSSGSREIYPTWSPDGKSIAYWSDISGEYELYIIPADTTGDAQKMTDLGAGFRYRPFWSPDSKKIAYIDEKQVISILDLSSKKLTKVDKCPWMFHYDMSNLQLSWSSDNNWLAYSKEIANHNQAIFLYNLKDNKSWQVTSGHYSDWDPVFDPEGKYLYFYTDRAFSPVGSAIDETWIYPNVTQIAAVSLRIDVPSPLAPRNDKVEIKKEEAAAGKDGGTKKDEKKNDKKDTKKDDSVKPETKELKIDIENFERRLVVLPPEEGNYNKLAAAAGQVIYMKQPRSGSSDRKTNLMYYDMKERKEETIIENIQNYVITMDGKKILVSQDGGYGIIDAKPGQQVKTRLRTNEMKMVVDPREEWKQIFNDVWRKYRDFFYDDNMHGVDWKLMQTQYGNLIDNSYTRFDVNAVLRELIGELNSSHTYVGGGDEEQASYERTGMLGIDWILENNTWKIEKIIKGASWDQENRSPLDQPGIKIKEGDYILAVNGIPLETDTEPWLAFQGLAGKTVMLLVNNKPLKEDAWDIIVETLYDESTLRNLDWMEQNRLRVDEESNGRIGYIYMPNTSGSGQNQLIRQFYAQINKEGFIIDERFNSGGDLPDRFLALLDRQVILYLNWRNGQNSSQPLKANQGPKVMLINGWSGSGGDALPYAFKNLGIGPVIGMKTMGALIGPAFGFGLIDGGYHTVPSGRIFGTDGKWFNEGHGVDPDILVVDDPSQLAKGIDPQLERGIQEVLKMLEEHPRVEVGHPPYEKR